MTEPPDGQNPAILREYLLSVGLAPRSVAAYVRVILIAEGWCESEGHDLRTASAEVVGAWAATVPFTTSSRRQARNALGHYWRMVGRQAPPLYAIRVPRKATAVCRALNPDEAKLLAKTARRRGDRPGLATLLALYLALRREEIARLRYTDFQDTGWLRIVGKREQSAMLPVHPVIHDAMRALPADGPWLFPGRGGSHVHPATVWNWVKAVAAEAGVEGMTTHRARHTALATANDNSGDLRAVQAFARHASPETTAIYTRATERRLRAAMEAIDY